MYCTCLMKSKKVVLYGFVTNMSVLNMDTHLLREVIVTFKKKYVIVKNEV